MLLVVAFKFFNSCPISYAYFCDDIEPHTNPHTHADTRHVRGRGSRLISLFFLYLSHQHTALAYSRHVFSHTSAGAVCRGKRTIFGQGNVLPMRHTVGTHCSVLTITRTPAGHNHTRYSSPPASATRSIQANTPHTTQSPGNGECPQLGGFSHSHPPPSPLLLKHVVSAVVKRGEEAQNYHQQHTHSFSFRKQFGTAKAEELNFAGDNS